MYEACGMRTDTTIQTAFDIKKVYDSNFIETENYGELESKENRFSFTLKPFEIKTFRICI